MIRKEYTFNVNELQGYKTLGVLEKTIEFNLVDEKEEIQSTSNHRYLLNPLDSNPTDSSEVQDKMDEVFTAEVKELYEIHLNASKPSAEEMAKEETIQKLFEAKNYLSSTDFYYARFLETNEAVPESVVLKRIEAREFIRVNTL